MDVSVLKTMTAHDKEVWGYMRKNHGGKCAYNTAKKCCGTCNNCPYDLPNHGFSKPIPGGILKSIDSKNDYEKAILVKQEKHYHD